MKTETIATLANFVESQRAANLKAVSAIIEVLKLLPAGPTREPAIDQLQEFALGAQVADEAAHALFEALRSEVGHAARS